MKASRVESPSKVCSHCQGVAVFKISYQVGSETYSCRDDVGKLIGNITTGPYQVSRLEDRPAFTPITLTLETQEEVDAIYALLDHQKISTAIGMPYLWQELEPFAKGYKDYLHLLDNLLKSAKQ